MRKFYREKDLNLIIDIGNNSTKFFFFKGKDLIFKGRREGSSFGFIDEYAKQFEIKGVIISSVVTLDKEQKEYIENLCDKVIWFSSNTQMPLNIKYRTPETLGSDRLAAAIGALSEAPGHNLLIIDAGSAITIDFVDAEGCYLGGNISPGVKMRLTALHNLTDKLPFVKKEGEVPSLGYDTETAIRSGVIQGICHEIDGYINEIRGKYPDVLVFLTGGDEKTLIYNIKNRIFADKLLVAKGLNRILTEHGIK